MVTQLTSPIPLYYLTDRIPYIKRKLTAVFTSELVYLTLILTYPLLILSHTYNSRRRLCLLPTLTPYVWCIRMISSLELTPVSLYQNDRGSFSHRDLISVTIFTYHVDGKCSVYTGA